MNRILVIDDDRELCELLTEYLGPEGFELEVIHDGVNGAERSLSGMHDLVVLDVMLPAMNGFDVLRKIRAHSTVPVIMLTARGDDVDRIVGLELGADDYLPKPFNPRELMARIRAIQRRTMTQNMDVHRAAESRPHNITVGDIELRPGTHAVFQNNLKIELTAVEFALLHFLLKNAGQVVTRDVLARKVLGRELAMFDRSIDVHVSSLRKKLGRRVDGQERITAIRGVGYQYILPA